ncbi:hypothetical protein AURDEDRAFT_89751 [Auricularia subglabra TFB-10046 SS5]|nr:hypothetical protein AURDEDRAFT_89751 [Auricularia subglabra TFB-10046 SS5]
MRIIWAGRFVRCCWRSRAHQTPSSSRVECTACGSRIRGRSLRAPCDHVYDAACISDLFEASMTDESLFPPRCCRQEIPVDSVRALISASLLQRFEAKATELRTLRRVYCANASCSRFLGAQTDVAASLACPACATTTCSACMAAHARYAPCVLEADAQAVVELARQEGWQRCPGCRRFIELETGCFHMTCRCRTEFCYVCAAPWKTCQCPQWEENRLVAVARRQVENEHGRALQQQNAQAARVLVQQAVERLRYDHDCRHARTKFRRGSHFQCENCHWHADQYILECTDCHTRLCKRCRNNRL